MCLDDVERYADTVAFMSALYMRRKDFYPDSDPPSVLRPVSKAVNERVDSLLEGGNFKFTWKELVMASSVHRLPREAGAELLNAFKGPAIRFHSRDELYELLNRLSNVKGVAQYDISEFITKIERVYGIAGITGTHIPVVVARTDFTADLRCASVCLYDASV